MSCTHVKFFPTSNVHKSGTCISVGSYFIFHSAIKHFNISALHVPCLFISFLGKLMSTSFLKPIQMFHVLDLKPQ